jgi:hypothetical protein
MNEMSKREEWYSKGAANEGNRLRKKVFGKAVRSGVSRRRLQADDPHRLDGQIKAVFGSQGTKQDCARKSGDRTSCNIDG